MNEIDITNIFVFTVSFIATSLSLFIHHQDSKIKCLKRQNKNLDKILRKKIGINEEIKDHCKFQKELLEKTSKDDNTYMYYLGRYDSANEVLDVIESEE